MGETGKRGSLERDEDVVVLSDTPQETGKAGKIEEDILKREAGRREPGCCL